MRLNLLKPCLILFGIVFGNLYFALGDEAIDFNRDIRPILSDNCFFCHGPDKSERKADLRLDTFAGATHEIDGFQAITPGDIENSELIFRILSTDPDELMPPPESNKKLSQEEIQKLTKWIEQGAEYDQHWAYKKPVSTTSVPRNASDTAQVIDQLIKDKLNQVGWGRSNQADSTTLSRRLHFDLIGLPPLDKSFTFSNDKSDPAYLNLVDELLSSSHFGERIGMYWLDLVRYADTVGYHGDQDHNIAPYRDYVIHSFNNNMPLDQFTREQIAGDLLPNPTISQKIASGYNRLLQTSHEGGVQPKEYLAIYAADRVRNFSAVWMGATVGCAQCHDHKYDPFTSKDFYALSAFFADIDETRHFKEGSNSLPTKRPPELDVIPVSIQDRIESLQNELLQQDLTQSEKTSIQAQIEKWQKRKVRTMITVSTKPRVTRVLPRGNWLDDSGEIVTPEVPEFLGAIQKGKSRATRLDLSRWLFTPMDQGGAGELTARVFANRIWFLMMGSGLSTSLDDFGGQGVPPTHPELLDFLAIQFMNSGWDIKYLIKSIVLSDTYKQSSIVQGQLMARDPENHFYSRQNRFRVPAEIVRDTALSISGLLQMNPSAQTTKPYQPAGYFRHLNFPTRKYNSSDQLIQWKRGVYTHWQRQFLHPMLKAFDAPSREECTAQRTKSNTPLAALTLTNDPTFVEAGRLFAHQCLTSNPDKSDIAKLQWMAKRSLSRELSESSEIPIFKELLKDARHYFQLNPTKANQLHEIGIASPKPLDSPIEWASWTQVARTFLNLNETYQRN